jgi:hypothetical protein
VIFHPRDSPRPWFLPLTPPSPMQGPYHPWEHRRCDIGGPVWTAPRPPSSSYSPSSPINFPASADLVVSNPDVPFPLHVFLVTSLGLYTASSSSAIVLLRCCAEEGSALSYCGVIKSHFCGVVEGAALSCSGAGEPRRRCAEEGAALTVSFWALC